MARAAAAMRTMEPAPARAADPRSIDNDGSSPLPSWLLATISRWAPRNKPHQRWRKSGTGRARTGPDGPAAGEFRVEVAQAGQVGVGPVQPGHKHHPSGHKQHQADAVEELASLIAGVPLLSGNHLVVLKAAVHTPSLASVASRAAGLYEPSWWVLLAPGVEPPSSDLLATIARGSRTSDRPAGSGSERTGRLREI